jgi:hypothetical protein
MPDDEENQSLERPGEKEVFKNPPEGIILPPQDSVSATFIRPVARIVSGIGGVFLLSAAVWFFTNFLQLRGFVNLLASRIALGAAVVCVMGFIGICAANLPKRRILVGLGAGALALAVAFVVDRVTLPPTTRQAAVPTRNASPSKPDDRLNPAVPPVVPKHSTNRPLSRQAPLSPAARDCPGTGEDVYKMCSDAQVGQWAIDESEQVEKLVKRISASVGSSGWRRRKFDQDFQECCSAQIKSLRAELLRRLGPTGSSPDESDAWTGLFINLKYANAPSEVDSGSAERYARYLRRLGLKLKQRETPRSATVHLRFEETLLQDSPDKSMPFQNKMRVTLHAPRELTNGYIAVEFDQQMGEASTDFQTSELAYNEINNPALVTMMTQGQGRVYALRIAANPFVPEVPVHVFVGSSKPIRVVGAFWFDE